MSGSVFFVSGVFDTIDGRATSLFITAATQNAGRNKIGCMSEFLVLSPDEPDPGRSSPEGSWIGEMFWSRVLDDGSLLDYQIGHLTSIRNLPVGEPARRVTSESMDWPEGNVWRIPNEESNGYIWGVIKLSIPSGCKFRRDDSFWEREKEELTNPNPSPLEQSILSSEFLRAAVSDKDFSRRLYSSLCNNKWIHPEFGNEQISWRSAGRIVALFRDSGENYMDFYGGGNEGHLYEDVLDVLNTLGWKSHEP